MEPDSRTDRRAHQVIGAAIEVHRILGAGFSESVYQRALSLEMGVQQIPFQEQALVNVKYKGSPVGTGKVDFLVDGCLVVELKAVETILPVHAFQVKSYLKATGLILGLLVNFNVKLLADGVQRVILSAHADNNRRSRT